MHGPIFINIMCCYFALHLKQMSHNNFFKKIAETCDEEKNYSLLISERYIAKEYGWYSS